MGNETEKNQQNPGQRRQDYPGKVTDPDKKNPSQSGKHVHDPQDPSKRKPGPDTREGSEDVEKRRAS